MFTIEKTAAELRSRFNASKWKDIVLTMKCNGDRIVITPCSSVVDITDEKQVEFFLIEAPIRSVYGEYTIEKVAEALNNYAALIEDDAKDRQQLAELKHELENPGADMTLGKWEVLYQAYSDWSKDIYGYRDRNVCRPACMGSWDNPARFEAYQEEIEKTAC